MIDEIPQKNLNLERTQNKQDNLAVSKKANHVSKTENNLQCFQWLNLHASEFLSTEDSEEVLISLEEHKENVIDTNNNSEQRIDLQFLRNDIYDLVDGNDPSDQFPWENNVKTSTVKDSKDFTTPKVVQKGDDWLIANKELDHVVISVNSLEKQQSIDASTQPLYLRPILKRANEYDGGSELNLGAFNDFNKHPGYNGIKPLSVSFLLPSHFEGAHNERTDSTVVSKDDRSIYHYQDEKMTMMPNQNTTICSNEDNLSTPHTMSLFEIQSFPISRPSSFSDSDNYENYTSPKRSKAQNQKLCDILKTPINIQEGGRYSILNRDFSSKAREKSVYMSDVENIKSEITSEKDKCILDARLYRNRSLAPEARKISHRITSEYDDDSSGESTDTLLEEARQYVDLAKDRLVTLEDWKTIEQNKKKNRKKMNRVKKYRKDKNE